MISLSVILKHAVDNVCPHTTVMHPACYTDEDYPLHRVTIMYLPCHLKLAHRQCSDFGVRPGSRNGNVQSWEFGTD